MTLLSISTYISDSVPSHCHVFAFFHVCSQLPSLIPFCTLLLSTRAAQPPVLYRLKNYSTKKPLFLILFNHLDSSPLHPFLGLSYHFVHVEMNQHVYLPHPYLRSLFTLEQLLPFPVTVMHTLLCLRNSL